jgi:hypothetical protein
MPRAVVSSESLPHQDTLTTTVIGRIAALGLFAGEPEKRKRLAWEAGGLAQRAWRQRYGTQPPKHNTLKACGVGVHCHARYPMDWCQKLDEIIMLCAGVSPTQPSFAFVMELSEATRGASTEDHGPWSSREEEEAILSASHWTVRVAIESLRDELRQARAALAEKERGAA